MGRRFWNTLKSFTLFVFLLCLSTLFLWGVAYVLTLMTGSFLAAGIIILVMTAMMLFATMYSQEN